MVNKDIKIAVVLGGGGIKPFAALPLFDFLKQHGMGIDLIVGSSGGAMIGAAEAANLPFQQKRDVIEKIASKAYFQSVFVKQILGALHVPFFEYDKRKGIISEKQIKDDLEAVFEDLTFNDLEIPLKIVGTGLWSGKQVIIEEGLIRSAVYASSAIYPFMSPERIGRELVMDGAFSNPIPVDIATNMGADLVIVITFDFLPDYAPSSLFRHFNNLFCHSIERKGLQKMQHHFSNFSGEVVHIDIILDSPVSIFETNRLDEILKRGKEVCQNYETEILDKYTSLLSKKGAA